MFYKDTYDLKIYVNNIYDKLESFTKPLGIFKKLDVCFEVIPPLNFEGIFCYTDKKGYHYCIIERGEIQINNVTSSLFEITYWSIHSLVSSIASDYERKNRIEHQDFRRIMFKIELELFSILGENYRKRAEIEIDEILQIAPFDDSLFQ